ncbi:MAG: hypothetical protein HQM12_17725 [SAR324 cluster bacterium]|nr:hypothetical protein [SAR324 cluster bacterium]MBF0350784.1 hypothetical protein [SAR324 cluster bacterium]
MSNDLLAKLGEKVQNAVATIEQLKSEIDELRERNSQLEAEKEEWDNKLSALLDQFDNLDTDEEEYEEDEEEEYEEDEDDEEYEGEEDEEEILEEEDSAEDTYTERSA